MKTLVLGLDCAWRRRFCLSTHGVAQHQSADEPWLLRPAGKRCPAPSTVPAWMCMATSQDPGSLGVYGFRNRTDYSYSGLGVVNASSITEPAIWDVLNSPWADLRGSGCAAFVPAASVAGCESGLFF